MVQSAPRPRRARITGPAAYAAGDSDDVRRAAHQGAPTSDPDADYDTDLSGFFRILRRNVLPIAALSLLSLLIGLIYVSITPPTYSATTTLLVDPRTRKIVTDEITQGGFTSDLAVVESQVPILTSDSVLGRVVDEQNLIADSEFKFYQSTGLVGRLKELIRGVRPVPDERAYAIEMLARKMQIHRAQKTYILDVEVETSSPLKSAQLATAIADAYIAEQRRAKADEAKQANKLIDSRLGELRGDVERAEIRVDEFKKANKIVTSEGGIVAEQQLGKLNTELATARAVAAEARARRSEVQAILKSGADPEVLPDAVKSALVQKLREQYAQVARRAASLGAQFQNRHPIMIDIRSQLREIRSQIEAELKRIVTAAKTEADIAAKRETELLRSLEDAKAQVARSNTAQIKLRELERELNASRDVLSAFLVRAKETQEQQTVSAPNARIVAYAGVPSFPSWPRPLLVLALAGLGGLGLGVAAALTRDHFDTSIGEHATHSTRTALPVLARLPKLKSSAITKSLVGRARDVLDLRSFVGLADIMLALRHRGPGPANSYRQAVLQILNQLVAGTPSGASRTFLLVSPNRNAGTTSTVLSLGYAAALAGERVLLVDAASADPELSNVFANNRDHSQRISLDSRPDLEAITVMDAESDLSVLPIATADLRTLKSNQRRQLIDGLRKLCADYDLIFIDAGALLEDATVMSLMPAADDVIVVARSGLTEHDELKHSERLLSVTSDNVLGTIVTMDPGSGTSRV